MTKKQNHYFWTSEEDRNLVDMKLDGKSTKKIIRSLKKLGYAKRTNSSVNTRCTILKQEYKVKDYSELLEKLKGENKSEQPIKEDGLKRIFDNFYEKKLSPYMKKLENYSKNKEPENYNHLEKYLAKDYIVLKINKIEKKLSEEEKSQLVKILEKLESRKIKNIKEKTNKIKNYSYPLPELTPDEYRKKILELKKQKLTNEKIYESFPKKVKQNVSAYLAHYTMGHYHKRKLV